MTPDTIQHYLFPESGEILTEEEVKNAGVKDFSGAGLVPVKQYVHDDQDHWLTDEQYKELSKEFDVKPKVNRQVTAQEEVQKKADDAKKEVWKRKKSVSIAPKTNNERDMSSFRMSQENVPQMVSDEEFLELQKQAEEDSKAVDPQSHLNPNRRVYYSKEASKKASERWEQEKKNIAERKANYEEQRSLREGYYTPLSLEDENRWTRRNAYYMDEISRGERYGNSPEQEAALSSLYMDLDEQRRIAALATRDGLEETAEKAYAEMAAIQESIKEAQKSDSEVYEKEIEAIEERSASKWLNGTEMDVFNSISLMDKEYEALISLEEAGASQEEINAQREKVFEAEESVTKSWGEIDKSIDAQYGDLEGDIASKEKDRSYAISRQRAAEKIGNDEEALRWRMEGNDLANELNDLKKQVAERDNKKEFFFNLENDPQGTAQSTLRRLNYTGEGIPGSNPIEKARNLYAINMLQLDDYVRYRFGEEGIEETGYRALSILSSQAESDEDKAIAGIIGDLKALAPLALINRAPQLNDAESNWDIFSQPLLSYQAPIREGEALTNQDLANRFTNTVKMLSSDEKEYNTGQFDRYEEVGSPYDFWTTENWSQQVGTTSKVMGDIVTSEAVTLGLPTKWVKRFRAINAMDDYVKGTSRIRNLYNRGKRGFSKALWNGLEEGVRFDVAGEIANDQEELDFIKGAFGGIASSPLQQMLNKPGTKRYLYDQVQGLFGNKTPEAVASIKNFGTTFRVTGEALMRGPGEAVQEFGEEIGGIYRDSSSWEEARKHWEERFGTPSQIMEFALSSALMGAGMGMGTTIGDYHNARAKHYYHQLSDQEKTDFATYLTEMNEEWSEALEEIKAEGNAQNTGNEDGRASGEAGQATESTEGSTEGDDTAQPTQEPDTTEAERDTDGAQEEVVEETTEEVVPELSSEEEVVANEPEVKEVQEAGVVRQGLGVVEDFSDTIEDSTKGKIGNADVILLEDDNSVTVESISVPEEGRGNGDGSRAMQTIIDSAKKAGKEVRLRPVAENKQNQERLQGWYESMGFQMQEDGSMVLDPEYDALNDYLEEVKQTEAEFPESLFPEVEYEGSTFDVKDGEFYDKKGQKYDRVPAKARLEYFANKVLPGLDPMDVSQRLNDIYEEQEAIQNGTDWKSGLSGTRMTLSDYDTYIGEGHDSTTKARIASKDGTSVEEIAMSLEESIYGDYDPNNPRIDVNEVAKAIEDHGTGNGSTKFGQNRKQFMLDYGVDPITQSDQINQALEEQIARENDMNQEELNRALEHEAESREEYEQWLRENIDEDGKIIEPKESPKRKASDRIQGAINRLEAMRQKIIDDNEGKLSANNPQQILLTLIDDAVSALKTGKQVVEVFEVGIKKLKESDWWKGASENERKEITDQFAEVLGHENDDNTERVSGSQRAGKSVKQTGPKPKRGQTKNEPDYSEKVESIAEGLGAKVQKGKNGYSRINNNNVRINLKEGKNGEVLIEGIQVSEKHRGKGNAKKALKNIVATAEKNGITVVVRTIPIEKGITFSGVRSLLAGLGFQYKNAYQMEYVPGEGLDSVDNKINVREALSRMFGDQIAKGATVQDLEQQIDANTWHEKAGVTRAKLKEMAKDLHDRRRDKMTNREDRVNWRVRSTYERIMKLDDFTDAEKEFIEANGDLAYEQLTMESVDKIANELWESIKADNNGDLDAAAREYMDQWEDLRIATIKGRGALAVNTNILYKIVNDFRSNGDLENTVKYLDVLAQYNESLGQAVVQNRSDASGETFSSWSGAKLARDAQEKTHADRAELEKLGVELRKVQQQLFDQDISIEEILNDIASKDSRIAQLLEEVAKVEKKAENASAKAKQNNKEVTQNSRKKPNRSAKKAKDIASKLNDLADSLGDGSTLYASIVPIPVLQKAIKAFAKAIEATGNTIQALDEALAKLRDSREYKNASPSDRAKMQDDVRNFLNKNVDGLEQDVKDLSKKYMRENKISLKELIEDHLKGKGKKRQSLAEVIAEATGITDMDTLKLLEKEIAKNIKDKVVAKMEDTIKRKFKATKDEDGNLLVPEKARRIAAEEIAQMVMMGALTNNDVRNAFSQYYGFISLDAEVVQKLDEFAEILTKLKESGNHIAAARVIKEMNKFLRKNTNWKKVYPRYWASMIYDYMHLSVLSGVKTQMNALMGTVAEMVPELLIRSVKSMAVGSPALPFMAFMHVLSNGTFKRAWSGSVAAARRNENDVASYGFYTEDRLTNISSNNLDTVIMDGYKKGEPYIKRTISVLLNPLRLVHMLGAQDVMINNTASEYLEYLDAYESLAGQKGKTWMHRIGKANLSKLMETASELMNKQDDPDFQQKLDDTYDETVTLYNRLGIKVDKGLRNRLETQMIKAEREKAGMTQHINTVKEMMLMNDPKGYGAHILAGMRFMTAPRDTDSTPKAIARLFAAGILLLPRIMVNSTSRMFNRVPLAGLIPSAIIAYKDELPVYKDGKVETIKMTPEQRKKYWQRAIFWNASYTALSMAAMFAMFDVEDDDEDFLDDPLANMFKVTKKGPVIFGKRFVLDPDRRFDVTGELGGFQRNSRSAEDGIEPLTVRWKKDDGEWVNITRANYAVSLAPVLHMLGTWRDEATYAKPEDWKERGPFDLHQHMLMTLGELTYAQTARDVKSIILSPEEDRDERIMNATVGKPLSLLGPRLYRDGVSTALSFTDVNRYEYLGDPGMFKAAEQFAAGRWFMDDVQKVDDYGYPLDYENKLQSISPGLNSYWEDHAEGKVPYELWHARPKLMDGRINKSNFQELSVSGHTVKGSEYSDEEKDALVIASRRLYGNLLIEYADNLKGLPDDQFLKATEKLRRQAVEATKSYYVGKYVINDPENHLGNIEKLLNDSNFIPPK